MRGLYNTPGNLKKLPRWKVLEGERIDQIGYQLGVRIDNGEVLVSLFFPVDSKTGNVGIFKDTQITKIMGGM